MNNSMKTPQPLPPRVLHPPFTKPRYIRSGDLLRQLHEQIETNSQRITESKTDRLARKQAEEAEEEQTT